MNYQVKDLDAIVASKGNEGIDEVSALLAAPETKTFDGDTEVKYELPAKAEVKQMKEPKMAIGEDVIVVKGDKQMFWKGLAENKSFQKATQTDIVEKAFPTNATSRPELSGAIREAVMDLTAMIYQSKLVDRVRKIPMDTPHLKIPTLVAQSGWAATQSEGSGKALVHMSGDYVNLETATESAYVTTSNQALRSVSAFATLVPEMLSAQISANLEGKITAAMLGASGKVQVDLADVSGLPEISDLATMYTKLFYRVDGKKALVVNPVVYARILSFQNISGVVGIIRVEGDKTFFLDAEIIQSPTMTTPASGASGTCAFVNLNYIALGQYGEIANEFNPFYAWENNGSSIRVEGEFAVAPMSNVAVTISGTTYSDVVVAK